MPTERPDSEWNCHTAAWILGDRESNGAPAEAKQSLQVNPDPDL